MSALLFIPWFKAEPWPVTLPGIGEVPIQPFGILVAIGVLFGAKIAEVFAKNNGVSPRVMSDFVAHVVIGGFIAGYFLNAAAYNWEDIQAILEDPTNLFRKYLGLSSFGGLLGALMGAAVFYWRRRLSLFTVGDAAAFAFPFGWIFGRTGCFIVHDHPGAPTDFFLAVNPYEVGYEPFVARHDLGLYEVFWSMGAIALFLVLARERRARGFYVAMLFLTYTPIRFFLDYLRAPPEEGGDIRYFGFTPGQYASLGLFLFAAFAMWWVQTGRVKPVPAHAAWPPVPGATDEKTQGRGPKAAKT